MSFKDGTSPQTQHLSKVHYLPIQLPHYKEEYHYKLFI